VQELRYGVEFYEPLLTRAQEFRGKNLPGSRNLCKLCVARDHLPAPRPVIVRPGIVIVAVIVIIIVNGTANGKGRIPVWIQWAVAARAR
jgi:hypothetical protein